MIYIYDTEDVKNICTYELTKQGKTPKDVGIEPIASSTEEFDLGEVLIINSKAYSVVRTSSKGGKLLSVYVYELPHQQVFVNGHVPESTYYNPELKCPFCGSVFEDTFEMDQDDDNYECPVCESVFAYESSITVNYHITPIKKSAVKTIINTDKEEAECN